MSNSAYITQVEKKIKSLITDRRYREAYNLCVSNLEQYPKNRKLEKLKKEIEATVASENEKVTVKKLKLAKSLNKEEKHGEALQILNELLRINPNDKRVKKEYMKTQNVYVKRIKKQKEEFVKRQTARLDEILNTQPDLLLEELVSLEMNNPGNKTVQDLTHQFREKLIRKKINSKGDLLKSKKFDAIESFLNELRKIDNKSPLVLKLSEEIERRKREGARAQKSEFVYGGSKHLDTLMKLKKYDKAIQVAKEILAVNGEDKTALRTMRKAKRKLYSQSRNISVKDIFAKRTALKEEYEKNKNDFVKL